MIFIMYFEDSVTWVYLVLSEGTASGSVHHVCYKKSMTFHSTCDAVSSRSSGGQSISESTMDSEFSGMNWILTEDAASEYKQNIRDLQHINCTYSDNCSIMIFFCCVNLKKLF